MRVVSSDSFTQRRQSRLQCVAVLLLFDHPDRSATNNIGRWQVGLTEAETDAAGLCAIRDLANHALFNSAQECRWLKLFQTNAILRAGHDYVSMYESTQGLILAGSAARCAEGL